MRSLAEGVETAQQLRLAVELGCTFAQGYYIARPMPAADMELWMADHMVRWPALPEAVRFALP
jgi:EAL domain-containing protein (putative c-di-GMP-specific phosphodiesterase class I)